MHQLDLTACSHLHSLNSSSNKLNSTLNLAASTLLTEMNCVHKCLTSIKASTCVYLLDLGCNSNKLKTLGLPPSSKLDFLSCHDQGRSGCKVSGACRILGMPCSGSTCKLLDAVMRRPFICAKLESLVDCNCVGAKRMR